MSFYLTVTVLLPGIKLQEIIAGVRRRTSSRNPDAPLNTRIHANFNRNVNFIVP